MEPLKVALISFFSPFIAFNISAVGFFFLLLLENMKRKKKLVRRRKKSILEGAPARWNVGTNEWMPSNQSKCKQLCKYLCGFDTSWVYSRTSHFRSFHSITTSSLSTQSWPTCVENSALPSHMMNQQQHTNNNNNDNQQVRNVFKWKIFPMCFKSLEDEEECDIQCVTKTDIVLPHFMSIKHTLMCKRKRRNIILRKLS